MRLKQIEHLASGVVLFGAANGGREKTLSRANDKGVETILFWSRVEIATTRSVFDNEDIVQQIE